MASIFVFSRRKKGDKEEPYTRREVRRGGAERRGEKRSGKTDKKRK